MKIGLVLSGGGARGIAHLGMVEALQKENVSFSIVSGASAGAIAGAFICAGYAPRQVLEIIQKTSLFRAMRPAFNWRSLLNIEGARSELLKHFPDDSFESLKIPFRVTTTDIRKGKIKVFKKGSLIMPVLASCTIPVIFEPIKINSRILVDGGIMDNLPVEPIYKKVDKIIALHCNPIDGGYTLTNWKALLERSMMMTVSQLAQTERKRCDIFMEPPGLSKYNVFDFNKANEIYQFGFDYATEEIENGILKNLK